MLTTLFVPALLACKADTTPTWAYDPIWLEPASNDGVHGFQTWQLYGPEWIDNYSDKTYACAVVTEISGVPTACDAANDCVLAWDVVPTVIETDCDPAMAENELFASLRRLALG